MKNEFPKMAGAAIAPRVARGFRLSWILYGVAAYYGLKYLNKRGILPNQTGAALDMIDKGIDYAKEQFGLSPSHQQKTQQIGREDFSPQQTH